MTQEGYTLSKLFSDRTILHLSTHLSQKYTYEINSLSNKFLKWRVKARKLEIKMHSIISTIDQDYDLLWAMDVIEHLADPIVTLKPLLGKCRLFIYDTEYSGKSGGRHPFHFQHREKELHDAWKDLGFEKVNAYDNSLKIYKRK